MRMWESLASERTRSLQNDAEVVDPKHLEEEAIWHQLSAVHWLTDPNVANPDGDGRVNGIRDWWLGTRVQDVWMRLHTIEEGIEASRSDFRTAVRHARSHVQGDAAATRSLNEELGLAQGDLEMRAIAVDAVRRAHRKSHQKHIDERQRNRAMVAFAATLALGVGVALLLQAYTFETTSFLVMPKDETSIGSTALLALVLGFGALGGFISALVSLYLTSKSVDDTMWFDPRPTLVAIKLSLGAWTAFLGVLMVGTGLIVGVYSTVPSAIILAFLFGYGQQAVTGVLLDRHVGKLSEEPKA